MSILINLAIRFFFTLNNIMAKSYHRHNKRSKRKHSRRRRRGGVDSNDTKSSSFSMSDMNKHISNAYQSGMKSAQPHVEQMNKMTSNLHKQATDNGKKAYSSFKYSNPANFAMAKSGESAYSRASKSMGSSMGSMGSSMGSMGSSMGSMRSSMGSMGSSMGSMGSSMGFSSLSSNKPNVTELEHAQKASSMGVPSAFSKTSRVSSL